VLAALLAAAALPWSPATVVSSPHTFVDAPGIDFALDHTGITSWQTQDGLGQHARVRDYAAALAPGATTFAPERRVPDDLAAPLRFYRGTRVMSVTRDLRVVRGRADGPFVLRAPLPHSGRVRAVQVAVEDGYQAVAWIDGNGLQAAFTNRASNRFGSPRRIRSSTHVRSLSLAVSEGGDVLVAWEEDGRIRVRVKRGARHDFDLPETLRSRPAYGATIRTAFTEGRSSFVAWGAQRLSEGGDRGPVTYEIARRASSGSRFHSASLLERQPATQIKGGIEFDPGERTVVWTGWDGSHYRVRAATIDSHQRFDNHQDVSPPGQDGIVAALASGIRGARLVIWSTVAAAAGGGTLSAAFAAPGQMFGAPELLAPGPEARAPAAAYDRGGRGFAAIWSDRPDPGHTVALASARPDPTDP
jgi:hypothetical protein